MNSLEHLETQELWSDFSVVKPFEESVNSIDQILREWTQKPIKLTKKNVFLNGERIKLVYVPKYFCIPEFILDTIHYSDLNISAIRELFGITTDFVYFCPKKIIDQSYIKLYISIMSNAIIASNFEFPIFIQVFKTDNLQYYGIRRTKSTIEHFNSTVYETSPAEFKSMSKIKSSILEQHSNVSNILVSTRYLSNLNELDFRKSLKFTKYTYYSTITNDPIKKLSFYLVFDETNIENNKIDILNPSHIAIQCRFRNSYDTNSKLRQFAALVHTVWTYPSIKAAIVPPFTIDANEIINSIFSQPEQPKAFQCDIHGAPPLSCLSKLAIEMCEAATVESMSLLWSKFVKQIRIFSDKNQIIPGVDTDGVNFQHCIIYQKLQMINYCIAHPEAGFIEAEGYKDYYLVDGSERIFVPELQTVPMRTKDQYDIQGKLLQNSDDEYSISVIEQLKSDIASFKAANPSAVFADFVHWYYPLSFDATKNDVKEGFHQQGKELWESTNACEARKQSKRLFDQIEQKELALDYLETLVPGDILPQMIKVVLESALYELSDPILPKIKESIEIAKKSYKNFDLIFKDPEKHPTMNDIASYVRDPIEKLEELAFKCSCLDSLLIKFEGCPNVVKLLYECGECAVSDEEKPQLERFFNKVDFRGRQAATARAREYIIRFDGDGYNQRLFISDRDQKFIVASCLCEYF